MVCQDILSPAAGISDVAYTDTEHYQVTRRFLSNPKRALETLLGEEPEADSDA
jgi:hypothetical protein